MNTTHFPLVQENDRLNARRALGLTALAVFVIMLVLVVSGWLLDLAIGSVAVRVQMAVAPGAVTPWEIGGVKQTMIRVDRYGQRLFAQQQAELDRYSWADPQHQRVNIPIKEAMRLVANEGSKP